MVGLVVFGLLSTCLGPLALIGAGIFSGTRADTVAGWFAPYLCPQGTSARIVRIETTTRDFTDMPTQTTQMDMHCVDNSGNLVKNVGGLYAILFSAIAGAAALLVSAVLALILAAPAGVLLGRWISRLRANRQPAP